MISRHTFFLLALMAAAAAAGPAPFDLAGPIFDVKISRPAKCRISPPATASG
jgi:hypothetical protein